MAKEWKKKYLSAIVIVSVKRLLGESLEFKKYRNISKKDQGMFTSFIRVTFPGAKYINYYERYDRRFVERVYL
jgi:hypothetical protein